MKDKWKAKIFSQKASKPKENISDDYNKTNINALKVEKIDDVLLHEREQLGLCCFHHVNIVNFLRCEIARQKITNKRNEKL